jgi:probable F420-dependent oxidoreductase
LNQPAKRWRDAVRRIEDLGFSAVTVSDHFTQGWVMEATIALMASADATERLRVQSLVLDNDYRHPVLLHKALATIDVLSGGRLEIGLGAGWMLSDYQASGIPCHSPGIRIARLEETVKILKGLFASSPFSLDGHYYRIDALDGLPKPLQQPHPPLLLGGGGKRILSLAAREANIVSVNPNLREGSITGSVGQELTSARMVEKIRWVREAAGAAGRAMDEIELQLSLYVCHVTKTASSARSYVSSFATALQAEPSLLDESPVVVSGTLEQCVEALEERRERYGFSCFNVGGDVDITAPLVKRLAGN